MMAIFERKSGSELNESVDLESLNMTVQESMYMSCHRDGGRSQGDTRHSMPPARRRGGFNLDIQLFLPPKR